MANGKQATARRMKMAERAAALQSIHFSNIDDEWIWHRKTNDGFTTIPRTLPLAMQAIDEQSKGQPPGHSLFCLWCRAPDHPLITIENPATFAGEAGFKGPRAVDTWRRRMKVLQKHNFLLAKSGTSGDFHYILLLNPNAAMEVMRHQNLVQDELYGRFKDRMAEVGAIGEMDALYALEARRQAAAAAQLAATSTANTAVPPPPPPNT